MEDENRNKRSATMEERLSLLEDQIEYYRTTQTPKISIVKKIFTAAARVFCRENLELFLSILSLTVSVLVAAYILYYR